MSTQVISFVADENYLDHARSVLVNCRRQGEWEGDFCLISPGSCDTSDFESRGIHVLHLPEEKWDFMVKFRIFTPYFHRWAQALCLDLDIMVQGNLQAVFDRLTPGLPSIFSTLEDGSTLDGLKRWDEVAGDGWETHPEIYRTIEERYPHVTQRMFNMAFIFYSPISMSQTTMEELRAVHEEFKEVNPSNADQMIVNLHLYDCLRDASKWSCCFFGGDYPENRVRSDSRGWVGDEIPAILHYTRWHAPWIVKQICPNGNEPGGYRNHRLGRLCHELYAENLAAFEEEFPANAPA